MPEVLERCLPDVVAFTEEVTPEFVEARRCLIDDEELVY